MARHTAHALQGPGLAQTSSDMLHGQELVDTVLKRARAKTHSQGKQDPCSRWVLPAVLLVRYKDETRSSD